MPFVSTTENQIITATNSNKIGIHSYADDKPNQVNIELTILRFNKLK